MKTGNTRTEQESKILKTRIDIVLFINDVRRMDVNQLKQLVKEYKEGQFEIV